MKIVNKLKKNDKNRQKQANKQHNFQEELKKHAKINTKQSKMHLKKERIDRNTQKRTKLSNRIDGHA